MKFALLSLLIACSSTRDDLQKIYDATKENPTASLKLDGKTLIVETASQSDCSSALYFWGWQREDALKEEGIKLVICGSERMAIP